MYVLLLAPPKPGREEKYRVEHVHDISCIQVEQDLHDKHDEVSDIEIGDHDPREDRSKDGPGEVVVLY